MDIDLNRLSVFKEVVLSGSFSKAALKLRQPKSRISRQISSLEQELGIQLIYRTTRQFQLTQAGEELFRRATPLLSELDQALEQVTGGAEEVSGLVKITAPEDLGVELMGRLCHEFMTLYPKVQLSVHVSNQYVDLVKESVDLAIRIGKARDSTMLQRKIGHIRLVLIGSPEFFKRYENPQKLSDLERLPFLTFSLDPKLGKSLKLSNGKETQNIKVNSIFACTNFFTLRSMVLLGAGFSLVPDFLANDMMASGRLVELFKEWRFESAPVSILTPQQKETPLKVKKLAEFLSQRLAQLI